MLPSQEPLAIWCYDALGNAVAVDQKALAYRPAVYGLFLEHGQVWLLRHPQTSFYYPPGVILPEQSSPQQALLAHLRQLTGLTLTLGSLIFLEEQYRIDEYGRAWHLSAAYYIVQRPALALTMPVDTGAEPDGEWVSLAELTREQMQFGYHAAQAARRGLF